MEADWDETSPAYPVAVEALPSERAAFIRHTYAHVGAALLAFTALQFLLFRTPFPAFGLKFLGVSWFSWLMVMAGFTSVARLAESWAESGMSKQYQYAALVVYVLAQALLFAPLIRLALYFGGTALLYTAVLLTLMLFTGLTVAVFAMQLDFSETKASMCVGGFLFFGLLVSGLVLGFQPGVGYAAAMIVLGAASILRQTSRVMNYYRTDQHVAASLALFASLALVFWYVVRIFLYLRRKRYN